MKKAKELHLLLDIDNSTLNELVNPLYLSYIGVQRELKNGIDILFTTQTHFLSFEYAEKLFVIVNGVEHEITIGKCNGTSREITTSHNLEKLLFSGEFEWFNPENQKKIIDNINENNKSEVEMNDNIFSIQDFFKKLFNF